MMYEPRVVTRRPRPPKRKHKFKVGDRVVYQPMRAGNPDIAGWHGTVTYIDSQEACYTVELDDAYIEGMTDERVRANGFEPQRGHSWFAKEENLVREKKR